MAVRERYDRIFSVNSALVYDVNSFIPVEAFKILGGFNLPLGAEFVSKMGGSNYFSWATDVGKISNELSFTASRYSRRSFEILLAGRSTVVANPSMASILDVARNGDVSVISSIIPSATNTPRFGRFVVEILSATEVRVHGLTDNSGAFNLDDENSSVVVDSVALPAAGSGVSLEIPEIGVSLELLDSYTADDAVAGESIAFNVVTPAQEAWQVEIGNLAERIKTYGLIFSTEIDQDGSWLEINAHNVVISGLPIVAENDAESTFEVQGRMSLDPRLRKVLTIVRRYGDNAL